jgi:FkbM family methyltransferase
MIGITKIFNRINRPIKHRSFALNEIDIKLKAYLNCKKGFFVEAGANDGVTYSNTLYFEKYKNWTGILIEPIPELAEKCRLNRPKCIVEQVALVPFGFKEPYIEMRYCNLMSVVKGGMKSEEEEVAHIEKGAEIQDVETFELKVPTSDLSAIIEKYSVRDIDFLSLDVEGFELSVLRGIDFDRHKPTFMLIEARYRDEIDIYLKSLYDPVAELSEHDVLYKSIKA